MKKNISIPVVLIIYNRLLPTQKTFASIKKIRPSKLYIIADGPKDKADQIACQHVRDSLVVNWPCQVTKLFANSNLGLRKRVVSGLNEVFKKEKWAIILEDDCVADQSFFRFATELLVKYESNEQVFSIAGYNGLPGFPLKSSYTFSRYVESWGWATWARAWAKYDDNYTGWSDLKQISWLKNYLGSTVIAKYWTTVFDLTNQNKLRSWAYRWEYSVWKNRGLTIVPQQNLIDNIGFGLSATNTKRKIRIPRSSSLSFPLKHPRRIELNLKRDDFVGRQLVWNIGSLYLLVKSAILQIWGSL